MVNVKDKLIKNIEWSKATGGAWQGSFVLADGYRISVVAAPDMKKKTAQSFIIDELVNRVYELADERGCAIFSK